MDLKTLFSVIVCLDTLKVPHIFFRLAIALLRPGHSMRVGWHKLAFTDFLVEGPLHHVDVAI